MHNRFIFTITVILLITISCNKKVFKRVTIGGRLVNINTYKPVGNMDVALYAANVTAVKLSPEKATELARLTTSPDGSFTFKCNAGRRKIYYIKYGNEMKTGIVNGYDHFKILDNSTRHIGDIYINP